MERWGHDLFKVAYSYIPQSTIAELMNTSGVCFLYERQDLFPEVQFLNTIHDSIRYQIPLSAGPARTIEIIKAMRKSLGSGIIWKNQKFSIPVDTEIGFTFDKDHMMEWKAAHLDQSPEDLLVEELEDYVHQNTA